MDDLTLIEAAQEDPARLRWVLRPLYGKPRWVDYDRYTILILTLHVDMLIEKAQIKPGDFIEYLSLYGPTGAYGEATWHNMAEDGWSLLEVDNARLMFQRPLKGGGIKTCGIDLDRVAAVRKAKRTATHAAQ